jgi:hypothetical protein
MLSAALDLGARVRWRGDGWTWSISLVAGPGTTGRCCCWARSANQVLTLPEVHGYGTDSFGDPDYLRLYGMRPEQWYARGIRLLGRTAVECTRDDLAQAIAGDVAAVAAAAQARDVTVIDPFAGSGNTIYWILRQVPRSIGVAFEVDPHVYVLSRRNLSGWIGWSPWPPATTRSCSTTSRSRRTTWSSRSSRRPGAPP